MQTLNIIGAGQLGKTLGRLWHQSGLFRIQSIHNRTLRSGQAAREFIGAGQACPTLQSMPVADYWLIACQDIEISALAERLSKRPGNREGTVFFHCSGALSSEALDILRPASIASAHPVHSFADPLRSLDSLPGSSVALEGDGPATRALGGAFNAIGCEIITIEARHKPLYHAGSVFACNYLTTLVDLSLRSFAAAGIERGSALKLLAPIVLQTARNNMTLGPEKSLTGPIARGDLDTVSKQVENLISVDPQMARCYRHLGLACVALAQRGPLSEESATRLIELLSEPPR
ncbi:Rossmann-like and DUF2520 domain-containing protein [Microbulbifer sp. 2205BS26-8]|uniref:Rossmann-like and DUF2520 domain-containing protein n=1 Tax=Microbulbifer sp. 2205BS26-8 TaxID=3064386 RepID=UPI00273D99D2|nr:Rossmann-like and DUF2520 domain-containing protein [Microbulbifer sp. 2205BS26-8]MDP5208955.1 DUF2520 domain-containing protein [Microbulbifer sp. 2205BS26-8]